MSRSRSQRKKGLMQWQAGIDRLYGMQDLKEILVISGAIFIGVLFGRKSEARRKTGRLIGKFLGSYSFKDQFPSQQPIGIVCPIPFQHPSEISGFDDASFAKPDRREMEIRHKGSLIALLSIFLTRYAGGGDG